MGIDLGKNVCRAAGLDGTDSSLPDNLDKNRCVATISPYSITTEGRIYRDLADGRQRYSREKGMAERHDVARVPKHPTANILMCPPNHFEVCYRINPWMDPYAWSSQASVLTALAQRQWRQLHDTLVDLGAKLDLQS